MKSRFFYVVFLVILNTSAAWPQGRLLTENQFYVGAIEAATSTLIEEQKAIYSGSEYIQYFLTVGDHGHPFFNSLVPESIMYDGVLYTTVDFIYDTFKDEVIVSTPDSNWIAVNKNKISYFYLGGHQFRKYDEVPTLAAGFYEVLYDDGAIALLARWSKALRASVWKEKVDYYIIRDKAYPVKSKQSLLQVLDKENEIRNFIRQNNLKFGKDKRSGFVRVVRFWASLK